MRKKFHLLAIALALGAAIPSTRGQNLLSDGNFQIAGQNNVAPGWYNILSISRVQSGSAPIIGWQTTASNQDLEIWASGFNGYFSGHDVTAPIGSSYFAEINATQISTLFQVVQLASPAPVGFSLAHRGRYAGPIGQDVMDLNVYDMGANTTWNPITPGAMVYSQRFSDEQDAWGYYGNSNMFTATAGNYYAFTFVSVSTANGNDGAGNFLGNVQFGYSVPEPSTYALFGLGALGLVVVARRKRA
jgi:hypothetical protein